MPTAETAERKKWVLLQTGASRRSRPPSATATKFQCKLALTLQLDKKTPRKSAAIKSGEILPTSWRHHRQESPAELLETAEWQGAAEQSERRQALLFSLAVHDLIMCRLRYLAPLSSEIEVNFQTVLAARRTESSAVDGAGEARVLLHSAELLVAHVAGVNTLAEAEALRQIKQAAENFPTAQSRHPLPPPLSPGSPPTTKDSASAGARYTSALNAVRSLGRLPRLVRAIENTDNDSPTAAIADGDVRDWQEDFRGCMRLVRSSLRLLLSRGGDFVAEAAAALEVAMAGVVVSLDAELWRLTRECSRLREEVLDSAAEVTAGRATRKKLVELKKTSAATEQRQNSTVAAMAEEKDLLVAAIASLKKDLMAATPSPEQVGGLVNLLKSLGTALDDATVNSDNHRNLLADFSAAHEEVSSTTAQKSKKALEIQMHMCSAGNELFAIMNSHSPGFLRTASIQTPRSPSSRRSMAADAQKSWLDLEPLFWKALKLKREIGPGNAKLREILLSFASTDPAARPQIVGSVMAAREMANKALQIHEPVWQCRRLVQRICLACRGSEAIPDVVWDIVNIAMERSPLKKSIPIGDALLWIVRLLDRLAISIGGSGLDGLGTVVLDLDWLLTSHDDTEAYCILESLLSKKTEVEAGIAETQAFQANSESIPRYLLGTRCRGLVESGIDADLVKAVSFSEISEISAVVALAEMLTRVLVKSVCDGTTCERLSGKFDPQHEALACTWEEALCHVLGEKVSAYQKFRFGKVARDVSPAKLSSLEEFAHVFAVAAMDAGISAVSYDL